MPEPAPAPLRLRAAAAALHLSVVGGMLLALSKVMNALLRRGLADGEDDTARRDRFLARFGPYVSATSAVSRAQNIWNRNRTSWGHRIFGLRVVDARTGGPVTVWSALRAEVSSVVMIEIVSHVSGRAISGARHAPDAEAQIGRACALPIASALSRFVIVPNRRRQLLTQLVAGTMVVRDVAPVAPPLTRVS